MGLAFSAPDIANYRERIASMFVEALAGGLSPLSDADIYRYDNVGEVQFPFAIMRFNAPQVTKRNQALSIWRLEWNVFVARAAFGEIYHGDDVSVVDDDIVNVLTYFQDKQLPTSASYTSVPKGYDSDSLSVTSDGEVTIQQANNVFAYGSTYTVVVRHTVAYSDGS